MKAQKLSYRGTGAMDVAKSIGLSDDSLMATARIQWQFGDWCSLAKINLESLKHHHQYGMLALMSAAGHLQLGNLEKARNQIYSALVAGCDKRTIIQLLISGVYNSLARGSAGAGRMQKALDNFRKSIQLISVSNNVRLLTYARASEQMRQLQIPFIQTYMDLINQEDAKSEESKFEFPKDKGLGAARTPSFHIELFFEQALICAPEQPALLIAAAEAAQRQGCYQKAIRLWQQLAATDGERMPQCYYNRLDDAYVSGGQFPLGADCEEQVMGDSDKHAVLKKIHSCLEPRSYLEIGVQSGKSFALAKCDAIGVDPMPQIKVPLGSKHQIVRVTSDEFFRVHATKFITSSLDMVLIDGMHLFEYALRDFINIERHAAEHTLVVIDDIFPVHPAQAERDRRTRAWTGDVWKLLVTLQKHRPDLRLLTLNASPTGLLCIAGLNKKNHTLQDSYEELVKSFNKNSTPPDEILARHSAVACDSRQLEGFIQDLKLLRKN